VLSLLGPTGFASHGDMIIDVVVVFFSGTYFYWNRMYVPFRRVHHMNPLFYIASSNSILPINAVDSRCGEKDFPGTSANSAMILEFNPAQEISSLQAQGMSMAFALLGFAVIWCVWARSLVGIAKEVRRWLGEEGRF
jgi:hypothetical protein